MTSHPNRSAKSSYRVYTYRDNYPRPALRFRNLEMALKHVSELMPAVPHTVEIGLRFNTEVASDGGILQMSLERPASPNDWWDRYFLNPHGLNSILIQREDAALESDVDRRNEGNKFQPVTDVT